MIKKVCFMIFTIISVLNLYGGGVVEESGNSSAEISDGYELSGAFSAKASGGSLLSVEGLECGDFSVDLSGWSLLSGGSSARVAVEDHIAVDASGSATINYLGTGSFNPRIDQDLSGGASVNSY